MKMKHPPHPGDLIRSEVIEPLGLSVSKAAAVLKVRRATLSDLLAGKAALSPGMALKIEKAFGPDMSHLLQMQAAYDLAKARRQPRRSAAKALEEQGKANAGIELVDILPDFPPELAGSVGEVVIRFGQLERCLFTAMARVQSTDEGRGADSAHYLELVGAFKNFGPLGKLIEKAKSVFASHRFEWIDFDELRRLRDQRNSVHDALVKRKDGTLRWQASSGRRHRPVDLEELRRLRDDTKRAARRLDQGSLDYKRSHAADRRTRSQRAG